MELFENDQSIQYLKKHRLLDQYKKVKTFIENGYYDLVDLRKRKPRSKNIWYFRINKQYRALAIKKDNKLIVFRIDDHQN